MRGQVGSLAFILLLLAILAGLLFLMGAYGKAEMKQALLDVQRYAAPATWSVAILIAAIIARALLWIW